MRWLVRLVTPPGGTVLDPFCGSGATGEAAVVEGFKCILIDQDPKSAELAKLRLTKPIQPTLSGDVA
jgi:site-specific DNA-methyltransferase (adenine-specific)